MGHKAVETTHSINNTVGPGTNEWTVQWWYKFCKGGESPEDEKCSSRTGAGSDNDQLRGSKKLILSQLQEVAEEHITDHSMVIWHLKQIRKVKKLNMWVPHELTTKKKVILKCPPEPPG